jgi:hypothetical protein
MLSADGDCIGSTEMVSFCLLVCQDCLAVPGHGVGAEQNEVVLVSVLHVLTAERGDDVAAVVIAVAQDAGVVGEEVVGSGVRELREGWSGIVLR